MKPAARPSGELRRLEALREFDLLDTPPEQTLDDLVALAALICEAPTSLISLIDDDRQWFKARLGLSATETPRDSSFCTHAILQADLFIVPDATKDARFADNPFVTDDPPIRFYAGAPLLTADGHAIGTLCVMDHVPRELNPPQREALRVLARQVMAQLEWSRQTRELANSERLLRTIFESEPECLKVLGRDGSLRMMNRAGLAMIEADSFGQVAGHCLYPLVVPEHRASFEALTEHVFRGESGTVQFQLVGLKGAMRWMETHGAPLRDARGDVTALLGITRDITERKRAQEALQASEEKFENLFESSPDAIIVATRDGIVHTVNRQAERLFGYQRSELLGRPTEHLLPERFRSEHVVERGNYVRDPHVAPTSEGNSLFARRKDGSEFPVVITLSPLTTTEGLMVISTVRDVTERTRAETRIRQLNRVYAVLSDVNQTILRETDSRAMLEAACRIVVGKGQFLMAWIGLLDTAGGQTRIAAHAGATNDTLAILHTLLSDEQDGRECAFTARALTTGQHAVCNDIAHDEAAANWRDAAMERGYLSMVSLPLTMADQIVGAFNLYSGESGFFDDEELVLLDELALDIGFALDVHDREAERRRIEVALRESEDRFRQLAENIQEVFWIADPAGREMLYISPAYEQIWGRTCASAYASASNWLEAIHPDDRARVKHAVESKQPRGDYDETYRIVRPDQTVRWIHDRAFPVRGATGELLRIVGTAEDITERRQLEEQFRQSQKMEAIGQLAGGVAHDFNNILAAIMMQADLAATETNPPPETLELLHDIKAATERAANLTRQLLAFSRRQFMQTRQLDLNDVVTGLTKMLQRILGEDVRLQLNLHARALVIRADAGMLDQVLLNLVVNARDAMPAGGQLIIETAEVVLAEASALSIADASPGRHACLSVTDTGSGIAPEYRSRIFEPFFTTKEPGKGTGLGLATVFGIVKQHGGSLAVESEVGQGTTFRIFFPVPAETHNVQDEVAAKPRPVGGTETILLVEDEPAVRMLTRIVLERAGYTVLEAAHGVEALRIWDEHRTSIRLLLTDMVMPEGVSGRDLAARLQASKPSLQVIFTSGYSADIAGRELVLQEGQNFIQKPSAPQRILETVRRCLDA